MIIIVSIVSFVSVPHIDQNVVHVHHILCKQKFNKVIKKNPKICLSRSVLYGARPSRTTLTNYIVLAHNGVEYTTTEISDAPIILYGKFVYESFKT